MIVSTTPIRSPAALSTGAPSAPGSLMAPMLIAPCRVVWPVAVAVVTVTPTALTSPTPTSSPPEAGRLRAIA